MAMQKKFKAQNPELTIDEVYEALSAQFPDYTVDLRSTLVKYVQVDKSLWTGVVVRVMGKGNINIFPQNGSFWVRFLLGFLIAYFTSGSLVDEVGGLGIHEMNAEGTRPATNKRGVKCVWIAIYAK